MQKYSDMLTLQAFCDTIFLNHIIEYFKGVAYMLHKSAKMPLSLMNEEDDEKVCALGRALSSPDRLRILRVLSEKPMNVLKIAEALSLPASSVSNHINVLEEANLINIQYQPAKKGHMKLCYKAVIEINILYLDKDFSRKHRTLSVEMPVGNYVDLHIKNSGYLANTERYLFEKDQIVSMLFLPERTTAQILGFSDGYVVYNFPNYFASYPYYNALEISFECCSEAPYYRNEWPSDITVWLNGKELVTFTAPGDFGGRAGNYSPAYWPVNATQYGLLYKISISKNGCSLNSQPVNSEITIDDFLGSSSDRLELKIGIKDDAEHQGGLNLFGREFGDYPQDILMKFKQR